MGYRCPGSCLMKQINLMPREGTTFPGGQPLQADRSDSHSAKRHHLVTELGEHPPNLAFLAFGQDELEHGRLTLATDDPSSLGPDLAVREPNTFGQPGEHIRVRHSGHERPVELFDAVARMCQPVGKVAVVGQDDEPGAVFVEAADGVDTLGSLRQEIHDTRTAGGIHVR
jgi:hypothetical protein